jgi:uncharacterized membrane protein
VPAEVTAPGDILHAGYVPGMSSIVKRGLLAGAAGTTVLNAVTYLDMALRGRPASDTPERTVDAGLKRLGRGLPGDSAQRDSRRTALGALSGIGSGIGIGVAASAVRAMGIRLPGPLAAVATGAGAMAATNLPMTALGLTDPRQWSAADWVSDSIPHLAYGVGTHAVIAATDDTEPAPKPSPRLVMNAFALGIATGLRSSLGGAAPGLFGRRAISTLGRAVRIAGITGELIVDKLPGTPSRLEPAGLIGRLGGGADGGFLLAHHGGFAPTSCMLAGSVGAAAGSFGGASWRRWAALRMPDWQGALMEDAAAITLAFAASRSS